jgi:histidinol dehydrogenase
MRIINSNDQEELNSLFKHSQFDYDKVNQTVNDIITDVKNNRDAACKKYTKLFDKVSISSFKIKQEEIDEAYKNVDKELISDLQKAYQNIINYHEKQYPKEYFINDDGSVLGQLIRPIERVGMYVPGGTAAYPSTVLMNAAPAFIAGVEKRVMITPPNEDGSISPVLLVAASIANISEIYKIGGAQGIAALAYGTETIPKVDKIVGPGNIYVAMAKKQVSGVCGIDMIAGPSEVVIIADETANPKFIAADLLAQAEHDTLAQSILLTTSTKLAKDVNIELERQMNYLSRKEILAQSISNKGAIILVDSIDEAISLSNKIAPEHLELVFENAEEKVKDVINAGAIFIGEYSPEPVGDYFAGPNHTLPTSGTARYSQALNVTDFVKRISYIKYSKKSLDENKDSIIRIAKAEGLTAHANSIEVRYE